MSSLTKDNVDDPDNTYDFKLMISDALTSMGILLFVGLVWTRVQQDRSFLPHKKKGHISLNCSRTKGQPQNLATSQNGRGFIQSVPSWWLNRGSIPKSTVNKNHLIVSVQIRMIRRHKDHNHKWLFAAGFEKIRCEM